MDGTLSWDFTMANYGAVWSFLVQLGLLLLFLMLGLLMSISKQGALDGVTYDSFCINNGENHLHGGRLGISKRLWQVTPAVEDGVAALSLTIHSPDGEEGYPGTLEMLSALSKPRMMEAGISPSTT